MAAIFKPNFTFADLEFTPSEARKSNTLAGQDLHIPSEEMQMLSRRLFDTDMQSFRQTIGAPDATDRLPRYKSPKLSKDAWTFMPRLTKVNVNGPSRLRATGTVKIFEQDGRTQREMVLNLDVDNSIPTVAVPEVELPFLAADEWERVSGYKLEVQKHAIKVLTYVAAKAHGRQFDAMVQTWCQHVIAMMSRGDA